MKSRLPIAGLAAFAVLAALLAPGPSADDALVAPRRATPPAATTVALAPATVPAPVAASEPAGSSPAAAASAPAAGVRAPIDPGAGRGLIVGAPPPPPPPPAPPVRPAPPPPAPPPVPEGPPLRIVGVVKVGTPEPLAFFALGDYLMQGRKGDLVDGRFRIEDITRTAVVVTELPAGKRIELTISTGG